MSGAQFRQPSSHQTGRSNIAVTIPYLACGTNRTSQVLVVSANFFRHLLRSNDVFIVIFQILLSGNIAIERGVVSLISCSAISFAIVKIYADYSSRRGGSRESGESLKCN